MSLRVLAVLAAAGALLAGCGGPPFSEGVATGAPFDGGIPYPGPGNEVEVDFASLEPDLRPYRLAIANHLAAVMAAHVVFPAIDELPASLSHRWITEILRGEMQFHGCVFADDLTMGGAAAFGDVATRARLAFAAGCDVLPICNDRAAVISVLDGFKPSVLNPASQARLVRMRARGEMPFELEHNALWREAVARVGAASVPPPLVLSEARG